MSHNPKIQLVSFFAIFLGAGILAFSVFLPYIPILTLAAIFAIAVMPLHKRILRAMGGRRGLASFVITILTLLLVVIPVFFIGAQVFREAGAVYQEIELEDAEYLRHLASRVEGTIRNYVPGFSFDFGLYAQAALSWIARSLGGFVAGAAEIFLKLFLFLMSLFFFLRDGESFVRLLRKLLPIRDDYFKEISDSVVKIVDSITKGTVAIAVIQGTLTSIGLLLFGVPNPTLWGSFAAVAAMLPGIGAGIVVIPAAAFLAFLGSTKAAIGLALWGLLVVGLVDNFLTPYFFGKGAAVHPLFILFAVLGGLTLFGPLGFVFGPLILGVFISLLHIYERIVRGEVSEDPSL